MFSIESTIKAKGLAISVKVHKREEKPHVYIAGYFDGVKEIPADSMTREQRNAAAAKAAAAMLNAYLNPRGVSVSVDLKRQ